MPVAFLRRHDQTQTQGWCRSVRRSVETDQKNQKFSFDLSDNQTVGNQNDLNLNFNKGTLISPINSKKNNDPHYLNYVISQLNKALDYNLQKEKPLLKELEQKDSQILTLKSNIKILNERNKLQDEIKTELEIWNVNIKNLDNSTFLKNSNFEKNLKLFDDRYKNLNLKIEIV